MKKIKQLSRLFFNMVLVLVFVLGMYLLTIFALSRITVNATDDKSSNDVAIYIKTNGVHTDIVVPVKNAIKDWSAEVKLESVAGNNAGFVGFGWGDKGFYLNTPTWSDLKISTACNAAFYLGTSAMHATFFDHLTESPKCVKLTVSNEEYKQLIAYIESGFQFDANRNTILIKNSAYGKNDSFYEANGKYSMFYTCNSWANNALKAAGQKAALWTLTDTGIFCHYE